MNRVIFSCPHNMGEEFGLGNLSFQQARALYEADLLEHCYCAKNSQNIIPKEMITEVGFHKNEILYDNTVLEEMKKNPIRASGFFGWISAIQQEALKSVYGNKIKVFKFAGSTYPLVQNSILEKELIIQQNIFRIKMPYNPDYSRIRYGMEEFNNSDYILCSSEFVKSSFIASGFDASHLDVQYIGTDITKYFPHHVPSDTFRVLFVGFNWFRKGLFYAIKSFSELDVENKKFIIKGNIDLSNVDPKTIECRTEIVDDVVMNYLYNNSDILFLPTAEEGCVQVILEAMACGLPVLTTKAAGSSELITHGVDGFVYNTPIECAQNLKYVYEHARYGLQGMGSSLRKKIEPHDWKYYRSDLAKYIEERL